MILNKPAGLAMHPTHNHQGDTLANAVAAYFQEQGRQCVMRCVGRLDRDTSGIVLCALNRYAAARLSGRVEKEYLAVVSGLYRGSGTIDRPIIRPNPMHTSRAVGEGGLPAVTHWTAVMQGDAMTLMRLRLKPGARIKYVFILHLSARLLWEIQCMVQEMAELLGKRCTVHSPGLIIPFPVNR